MLSSIEIWSVDHRNALIYTNQADEEASTTKSQDNVFWDTLYVFLSFQNGPKFKKKRSTPNSAQTAGVMSAHLNL